MTYTDTDAPTDSNTLSTEDEPTEAVATDATEAPAESTPAADAEAKARRGRGGLEAEVKRVCDDFVQDKITLAEGELLTPHRIAKTIKESGGLSEAPSTGAVAAVLGRWKEIGFAVLNDKPLAFSDYTDEGRTEGLTALKAASADRKRGARAAAKAAEAAAAGNADGSTDGATE